MKPTREPVWWCAPVCAFAEVAAKIELVLKPNRAGGKCSI